MIKIQSILKQPLPFQGAFAMEEIVPLRQELLNLLDRDEKQELEAFKNMKRQREYLTSRVTLKKLAGSWGMREKQFQILKDDLGCPYGAYDSIKYFISIAHTQNTVFCGISGDVPIGLDLEPTHRRVAEGLKLRIGHPDEADLFEKLETIRLWTIKEALVKLEGQGLRLSMNQVCLQQHAEEVFFTEINKEKIAKICSFEYLGHWLAIAFYL